VHQCYNRSARFKLGASHRYNKGLEKMKNLVCCINGLVSMVMAVYLTKDVPTPALVDMVGIYLLIYWGTVVHSVEFHKLLHKFNRRSTDKHG
jgi:hypothetical protein